MADDILDELWGDSLGDIPEVDYGKPYGLGVWKDAVLMDVDAQDEGPFGFTVKLQINLKGAEGMPITGYLNLPNKVVENGDHDKYERRLRANEATRNNVHGLLKDAGLLKGKFPDIDTVEKYEQALSVLRNHVGNPFPCRFKQHRKFNPETKKYEDTRFVDLTFIGK